MVDHISTKLLITMETPWQREAHKSAERKRYGEMRNVQCTLALSLPPKSPSSQLMEGAGAWPDRLLIRTDSANQTSRVPGDQENRGETFAFALLSSSLPALDFHPQSTSITFCSPSLSPSPYPSHLHRHLWSWAPAGQEASDQSFLALPTPLPQ
ncbi:hypothetical protein AOLI_G00308340 [Acnodon oligacanthus]